MPSLDDLKVGQLAKVLHQRHLKTIRSQELPLPDGVPVFGPDRASVVRAAPFDLRARPADLAHQVPGRVGVRVEYFMDDPRGLLLGDCVQPLPSDHVGRYVAQGLCSEPGLIQDRAHKIGDVLCKTRCGQALSVVRDFGTDGDVVYPIADLRTVRRPNDGRSRTNFRLDDQGSIPASAPMPPARLPPSRS